MAQLIVRNLDDSVKDRLRARAKRNGHSLEQEVRDILDNATQQEQLVPLGTRISRRFAGLGLKQEIPALRGEPARPAKFKI
jgi:plasmid stability protein